MKKILIYSSVAVLLVYILCPFLTSVFWSVLVLSELLNFESKGWIEYWSKPPQISPITFQGPSGPMKQIHITPQMLRRGLEYCSTTESLIQERMIRG